MLDISSGRATAALTREQNIDQLFLAQRFLERDSTSA